MWMLAYETRNLRAANNPYTPGQCGGMCGVWLANMYNRAGQRSVIETKPHPQAAIDTHLAGLHVAPGKWHRVPDLSLNAPANATRLVPNIARLPVADANVRYLAAAGLKAGPMKQALWTNLGNWFAQTRASGGYFIDVGGHAIAIFVNWKRFASYEKTRRLYYFDPNHGCYFAENELSFNSKFRALVGEHLGKNPLFSEHYWSYFKAVDVGGTGDDDADIDLSPLFG